MENKKTILKKKLKGFTKPKTYSAEEIRKMREEQDAEDNKIGKKMPESTSPFSQVRRVVKNRFGNLKANIERAKAERETIKADKDLKKIQLAKAYDDAPLLEANYAREVSADTKKRLLEKVTNG